MVLTVLGVLASALVLAEGERVSQSAVSQSPSVVLPAGCVRPPGGFLVLQSAYGYNDSILGELGPRRPGP